MLRARQHFKCSQIIMHWVSAILVITILALPLARDFFASLLGDMGRVFMWHKSLALIIFVLTIIRILMMRKIGRPATLASPDKAFYRIASQAAEGLIYLALLTMPIFGYLMGKWPINFFNQFQIPALDLADSTRAIFHTLHIYTAYTLIALICLHVAAALFHYFILRDNVLQSMLTCKED